MISESSNSYWYNTLLTCCGFASFFIFLQFAKRGKFLIKRKRFKKNRRYIRLCHLYEKRMRENDGIRFVISSFNLNQLKSWRKLNVYVNFIPKRFKRRSLPWRLIRRKKR